MKKLLISLLAIVGMTLGANARDMNITASYGGRIGLSRRLASRQHRLGRLQRRVQRKSASQILDRPVVHALYNHNQR